MKKVILTTLTILTLLVSCQSDNQYEERNRDPKNPTQVSAEFLFNSATKSLFDQMTSTNVNENVFRMLGQHWTETTYVDEANYDFNGRNITQNHWSEIYRNVLLDLATAKANTDADAALSAATKKTKNAQIEILAVYTWAQMVETYGNIPYSQALNAGQFVLPVYDDAATIYGDLLKRLTATIPNLTDNGFGSADKIYGGDAMKWKKLGNSLLLRMGLRVADVPTLTAQSTAAIKAAVSGGVFTSNEDNAALMYSSASPNTNPVWVDLVQSGRSDFVVANTLVDKMNELSDPRRTAYFDENLGAGVFKGGPYGDNNSFSAYTHVSSRIIDPANPASLMDYSEVCFYLADAAERSISGTPATAASFYNNGITASFDYWGATDVAAYLANPKVNYATAAGDWKVKIGTQLWLAMYNRGYEAWTAWRTYDFPGFKLPAVSELPVPTRYTYPINEQNLNKANYTAAAAAIGGDKQTTKVFWDK
ncbi:MAG: SusD/RagB family nutrient-binding outer membrane lipoprotein [Oligoflexus sp.]|nr:SusD/RagB family nutrient-binding outer membrane lipoprotein [Pseudopedobacter sp.]